MSSLEEQKTLPFGFAKRNGVVIQGEITDTGSSEVICREGLDVQVLAEVQRYIGRPLHPVQVDNATFDRILSGFGQIWSGLN